MMIATPATSERSSASTTDALLKKYSTQLTAALAVVVCVTGIMMFFHLYKGEVAAMHEWLGMGFVAAVGLHLARHRRPLGLMLKQHRMHALMLATLLAAAAFLAPSSGQEANPVRSTLQAVMRAPLKDLAPVLGLSNEELAGRLSAAGTENPAPEQSLETLARSQQSDPMKLLAAVVGKGVQSE